MKLDSKLEDYSARLAFKISRDEITGKLNADRARKMLKQIDDIMLKLAKGSITEREAKRQIHAVY